MRRFGFAAVRHLWPAPATRVALLHLVAALILAGALVFAAVLVGGGLYTIRPIGDGERAFYRINRLTGRVELCETRYYMPCETVAR